MSFLIIVLYIRIVLEIIGSLAHDVLNPRREHRILIAHRNEEEDARTQHIIEVVSNKRSDELVFLLREADGFLVQLLVDSHHVATVHDSLVVLVYQFAQLILNLLVFFEESEELIVHRSATYYLLCIIELHRNASTLQYQRQHRVIIHKDIRHLHRVDRALKMELSVYYIARIHVLEIVVFQYLKVQHASV